MSKKKKKICSCIMYTEGLARTVILVEACLSIYVALIRKNVFATDVLNLLLMNSKTSLTRCHSETFVLR